jgi:proliferating cell nuclear antigen
MPLKFEFPDARDWRYLMESLEAIIEEANFIADAEGLRLRALDASRVAMVDLYIPREAFQSYELDEERVRIGVNFDDLNKVLKRAKADDRIIFSVEGNRLRVTLASKAERTFSLPLIDVVGEELPVPKVSFDVMAKMVSDTLRDALKDAEMISDTARFIGEEKELKIKAKSDKGEVEAKFTLEGGSLLEYEVKQPSTSNYGLDYLNEIVGKAYRVSDLVTLEFSTNKPLSLTFDIAGGGILRYFLAPRME